ncbi:MAG TPA: hypothetical protein DDY70_05610, partial [Clostridiales bacterium]|nr:hypothetical protein [Clostridiales bacterium]
MVFFMHWKRLCSALLSVALLMPCVSVIASEQSTKEEVLPAEIAPAPDGARAILSMTFDDGDYDTAVWLDSEFEKYGLAGSCMLIVGKNIANTYDPTNTKYLKWKELFAKGRLEPQSHTMTHDPIPAEKWATGNNAKYIYNNTQAKYKYELIDSRDLLDRYFPDQNILTLATSNNTLSFWTFDAEEDGTLKTDADGNYIRLEDGGATAVARRAYYAVRQGERGLQSLSPDTLSDGAGSWRSLYMHRFLDATIEKGKGWIDDAVTKGGWLITLSHGITATTGDYNMADADAFFAHAAKYVASGELWCGTFSEATRYVRERQNSTVRAVATEGGFRVGVTLAAMTEDGLPLPADVFNYPLTVNVEVPTDVRAASYVEGGVTRYTDAFTADGKNYVAVHVVPGTEVEVTSLKTIRTVALNPAATVTVVSDGTTVTDSLTVSAGNVYTPGKARKVYLKLSLADLAEGERAFLPLSVTDAVKGTVYVWGSDNTAWDPAATDPTAYPANAILQYGVDPSAVYGGKALATVSVVGAGDYPVEITEFVSALRTAGKTAATVILTTDTEDDKCEIPLAFDRLTRIPAYSYTQNFEKNDCGLVQAGVETGDLQTVDDTDNRTEGGSRALHMRTSANFQRMFLPFILNRENTVADADIGNAYTLTMWYKVSHAGTFRIGMADGGKSRGTACDQPMDITVSAEQVDTWQKLTYTFTVTEKMQTGHADAPYSYLIIYANKCGQSKSDYVDLWFDDLNVERSDSVGEILTPTVQTAIGADSTHELSAVADATVKMAGIRKAYAAFRLPAGTRRGTLSLRLPTADGRFALYAVTSGLPDAPDYDNVPAASAGELPDLAAVYGGKALWEGAADGTEVALTLPTALLSASEDLTLILVSTDAVGVTFPAPAMSVTYATNEKEFTVTIRSGTVTTRMSGFDVTLPAIAPAYFDTDGKLYAAGDVLSLSGDITLTALRYEQRTGAAISLTGDVRLRYAAVADAATAAYIASLPEGTTCEATGSDGTHTLTGMSEGDGVYTYEFAADPSVTYTMTSALVFTQGGRTFTVAAKYNKTNHRRTLIQVVNAAYADRRTEKSADYPYLTVDGD